MHHSAKRILVALLACIAMVSCREVLTPQGELPVFDSVARLNAIHFVDGQTGFVAGGRRFEEMLLQQSLDGGATWVPQSPVPVFNQILFDLDFLNDQYGFAAGLGGKLLETRDGGLHWETRQLNIWYPMHAIEIVNDSLVVAVGGNGYDRGIIQRSQTAGGIWAMVDTFDFELRDVCFVDSQVGFACGYGVVLKTLDGGNSWSYTDIKGDFFSTIHFPSTRTGYVAGRAGSLFKTTDAGDTWTRLRNGNSLFNARDAYNALYFLDEQTGYVVGDKGLVLKTDNGGENWLRLKTDTQADLQDLHVFREGELVVVGTEGIILYLFE